MTTRFRPLRPALRRFGYVPFRPGMLGALLLVLAGPAEALAADRILTYEGSVQARIVGLNRDGLSVLVAGKRIRVPARSIRSFKWSSNALLNEAEAAFRAGRWAEAERKLARVCSTGSVRWLRARLLAKRRYCLRRLGRRREAAALLAGIVADTPEVFLEGAVPLPMDSPAAEQDIAALRAKKKVASDTFVLHAVLAVLMSARGDRDGAEACRTRMKGESRSGHAGLGALVAARVALQGGAPDIALRALDKPLRAFPPGLQPQVHYWRGRALEGLDRREEALFAYLKAGLLYPEQWGIAPAALARAAALSDAFGRRSEARRLRAILSKDFPFALGAGERAAQTGNSPQAARSRDQTPRGTKP